MANSYNSYIADGSTSAYAYTFDVLRSSVIDVYLQGTLVTTGYSIDTVQKAVVFLTPPSNGVSVLIRRRTLEDVPNKFGQDAAFTGPNLDENFTQLLYSATEASESSGLTNSLTIRVPVSESSVNEVPGIESRKNRVFMWDGNGQPIAGAPVDGSTGELALEIAHLNSGLLELQKWYAGETSALVVGTFASGGTLVNNKQLLIDTDTGKAYYWGGTFNKAVPPDSSVAGTGGIGPTAWVLYNGTTLRGQLGSTSGLELVGTKRGPLSKAVQWYTPEQFGAVGDGVNDDSAAWQAMLSNTDGVRYFKCRPDATYKLVNGVGVQQDNSTVAGCGCKIYYPRTTAGYYHCFRVEGDGVTLKDMTIYSDAALVRGDTGFAISVYETYDTTIHNVRMVNIASACVWVTRSDNCTITNSTAGSPKADGFHFSNGCTNCRAALCVASGCHDDSFAIVKDDPLSASPARCIITNCVARDNVAGHGTVLIGCFECIVANNVYHGLIGAAVGSYFWQLTASPTDADWAANCLVTGNIITSIALSPPGVAANCGIYAGAFLNSVLSNNMISCAQDSTALGAPGTGVLIDAARNLTIMANVFKDSTSYAVSAPDNNVNEALNFTGIDVVNNVFNNIQKDFVHLATAASGIGNVYIRGNTLIDVGYASGWNRTMYVARTGSNRLRVVGNHNLTNTLPYSYLVGTVNELLAMDNYPPFIYTWTPTVYPVTGSWTAYSATGYYYMAGGLLYYKVQLSVSNMGTGAGLRLNLPRPALSSVYYSNFSGRNDGNGNYLFGFYPSAGVVDMATATGGTPITASGQGITLSGAYTVG